MHLGTDISATAPKPVGQRQGHQRGCLRGDLNQAINDVNAHALEANDLQAAPNGVVAASTNCVSFETISSADRSL